MENQSSKYGNVQKCPNCGQPVEPMAVKCNTCGYEFRNVEALNSSQLLANKLEEIDLAYRNKGMGFFGTNEQKCMTEKSTTIKNFPIPTTKEDILDFAITMQSRWKTEQLPLIRSAYKAKYDECVTKAKLLFPNDPAFQGIFDQHKKDKKTISPYTKMLLILAAVIAIIVILLVWGIGSVS